MFLRENEYVYMHSDFFFVTEFEFLRENESQLKYNLENRKIPKNYSLESMMHILKQDSTKEALNSKNSHYVLDFVIFF